MASNLLTNTIVVVRNFGDDTHCHNATQLKDVLQSKYIGKDVSLVVMAPNTMQRVMFTSIQNEQVVDSYTHEIIDVDKLFLDD